MGLVTDITEKHVADIADDSESELTELAQRYAAALTALCRAKAKFNKPAVESIEKELAKVRNRIADLERVRRLTGKSEIRLTGAKLQRLMRPDRDSGVIAASAAAGDEDPQLILMRQQVAAYPK